MRRLMSGGIAALLIGLVLGGSAAAQMQLNGAGATFPYPMYSKWFNLYIQVDPDEDIARPWFRHRDLAGLEDLRTAELTHGDRLHVALPQALPPAAVPDRDPGTAVDPPAPVATDDRRALVEADDRHPPGRL